MSWNQADAELLLSSAKDNQIFCWNLSSGEVGRSCYGHAVMETRLQGNPSYMSQCQLWFLMVALSVAGGLQATHTEQLVL